MVVDAVRTYLDAANGLTELSRRDAVAAARALLRSDGRSTGAAAPVEGESAPRVGQSIQVLAGELIETSQANRAAIADLVREEVGRQLETMDVVPRSEHERLSRRVAELERRLAARHAVERALSVDASATAQPSESVTEPRPETPDAPAPDTAADEAPEASETPAVPEASEVSEQADAGTDTEQATDEAPQADAETTGTPAKTSGGTGSGQARSGSKPAKSRTTKAKPAAKRTTKAKTKK
ncbi:hypothetical protein IDM40_13720 [Nocardiopsis sp. HNM0947]|uniref:Membrane fusogenic activity family protein n=1 Tax=Nocardiopsis coralli TaxID=2772213 RepID=A0ABR9P7F9_9ACTN|nr:hypothetical protein [Nocardiopsis coralli]MBE2999761.1 hypothetical protein [Nocardiopsis coralli]